MKELDACGLNNLFLVLLATTSVVFFNTISLFIKKKKKNVCGLNKKHKLTLGLIHEGHLGIGGTQTMGCWHNKGFAHDRLRCG